MCTIKSEYIYMTYLQYAIYGLLVSICHYFFYSINKLHFF